MARYLIVFVMVPLFLGCGLTPAARERAAADEKRRADHIAKLKSYVPEDVLKTVDPEFYTYPGFRDWWRFPLVYPYSIRCIDTLDSGGLCRHDGTSGISDGNGERGVGLGLTEFEFDAHFLVGLSVNKDGDLDAGAWVLVEFTTGKIDSFRSKEELTAAAKARGYSGNMELAGVESHYRKCFD
jgi:hypothetical protein